MTEMHPGDRTYRNQAIRLADLTVTSDVITGVTFEGCTIIGPAVVVPMGSSLSDCVFEGPTDALFWPLGDRSFIVGAVGLDDCTIVGCRFQRVAIAYRPDEEEMYRREFGWA